MLPSSRSRRGSSSPALRFTLLLLCAPAANAAITITTDLIQYATLNNTVQPIAMQATGAQTQLQWSISTGALPPGLTLTAGGLFSGTPSKAGTYPFTVRAAAPQEPNNTPGTKSFTIAIPQIITASPLPPATVGVPYSVQFVVTDGPPSGAFWSVNLGGLPLGITMDSKTGIYSGTPVRTGTFNPTIVVGFGVALATKDFSLTINAATQTLNVAPSALSFTASLGNTPDPQNLAVFTTAASPASFTVQVDDGQGGPAPSWLTVSPKAGTTPALLHANLAPPPLPVGTYRARIRISLAGIASLPPIDVPVTLTVLNAAPSLSAAPLILRFSGRISNPLVGSQTIVLRNAGGGVNIPFQVSVVNKSPWIVGVDSSSNILQPGGTVTVTVTASSLGLPVGSYRDAIRFTTPLPTPYDQLDIPVSAFIADAGSILDVNLNGVRFATSQGNQSSRIQPILVRNLGDPASSVNWTAQVVRGAGLVNLTNAKGTSKPNNPSGFGIRLSDTAADTAGGKFALIQITDPQSQTSPQFVVVLVDVAPAGTPPVPDPDPAGLVFVATSGAAPPASQPVTVNATSHVPVQFSVATLTNDGASWLSASPTSGVASDSNPAQVSVSVTPGSLSPGIYTGTVNIAIGAIVRGVTVTMILQPPGTAAKSSGRLAARAATCTPSSVVLAQTGIFDNFSVPAGWPATLVAQLYDNCGNPLPNSSVVASFSNGDAPVSLLGDGQSANYSATWQPGTAASTMTVNLNASSGSLTPAQTRLSGTVGPNAQPAPSLVDGGLLNNLNPQVGAPLAPGTVTQVYGDNLADAPDQPSIVPLPTDFKTVQAIIGGLPAPFFYVSKTQLVIQIPSELAPNRPYSALLIVNNQVSLPQTIALAPATPGTVAFLDGTLVAQHADYRLVTDDLPAKPDEPIRIYLVGMGATDPPVASGVASPSDPLARVPPNVRVTVDGEDAKISYAGLTPGGVGLYQIDFTVPGDAKTGKLPVVITQGDVPANSTRLTVVR